MQIVTYKIESNLITNQQPSDFEEINAFADNENIA